MKTRWRLRDYELQYCWMSQEPEYEESRYRDPVSVARLTMFFVKLVGWRIAKSMVDGV